MTVTSELLEQLEEQLASRLEGCRKLRAAIAAVRDLVEEAPAPKARAVPDRPKTEDRSSKAAPAGDVEARIKSALSAGPLSRSDLSNRVGQELSPKDGPLADLAKSGVVFVSGHARGARWHLKASGPKEAVRRA
jgi:hypothetical protein